MRTEGTASTTEPGIDALLRDARDALFKEAKSARAALQAQKDDEDASVRRRRRAAEATEELGDEVDDILRRYLAERGAAGA
jgi:hypothetical protein